MPITHLSVSRHRVDGNLAPNSPSTLRRMILPGHIGIDQNVWPFHGYELRVYLSYALVMGRIPRHSNPMRACHHRTSQSASSPLVEPARLAPDTTG